MSVSRLHLVTDTRDGRDPVPDVEAALAAGVDWVQVRSKHHGDRGLLRLARRVVAAARPYGATVVVDDRADIAVAAGAHGVHVGADDLPVEAVRRVVGADALVGATVRDPESAAAAVAAGADYLGVGPAFPSVTKAGLPQALGAAGVASVAHAVPVPVIGIGGVDPDRAADLLQAGAHGVAVVSTISAAPDPAAAAAELLKVVDATTQH